MPIGFQYYKSHTITGSTDGALTDYQVRVTVRKGSGTDSGETVYLGTNVLDSFIDVVFTSSDGLTTLSHWRDQSQLVSATSCVFWVKVPSIPASPSTVDIRVYYGKASATATDSVTGTMLAGNDFRSMRQTIQIASGSAPRWVNGVYHHSADTIYHTLWDSGTLQHWLYQSTDGCATAPTSVSTIYAASSSRSHSNLTGDGSTTLWAVVKSSTADAVYVKKSTDSGSTWGSEVTVASSLAGVTDPTPIYVSSSSLLICVRVTSGGNNIIRCYESTDGGATWGTKSTVHTETSTGINGLEDLDAVITSSGRILVAWERETAETGEARCDYSYSDDNGATWATVGTIVNSTGTIDDEGGSFAERSDGTIDYVFGSNVAGGTSYLTQQAWLTTYTEGSDTWSTPVVCNESYDAVENNVTYDSSDTMILFNTRQYVASGGDSGTYVATVTRLTGDDWSDIGATQGSGLSYVTSGGAWVEGFTLTGGERGYLVFDDYSGGDSVIEMLAQAPSPLTDVDLRMVFRYGDTSNHYLLSLLKSTSNKLQWYKRIDGAHTLLQEAAYTPAINTDYRIIATLRGTNPTTLTVTVNGTTVLSSVTETTSTRTSGKVGVAAAIAAAKRATRARHLVARKYTANEPAHSTWGSQTDASVWTVTLTDTASATDLLVPSLDTLRALTDTASATDLLTAEVDAVVALLDAASASDVLTAAAVVQAVISDLAGASDTSTATFEAAGTVTLSDLASATDSLTCAATLLVTLADSASGTDAYTAAAELVRTLTDAASATDTYVGSVPIVSTVSLTDLAAAVEIWSYVLSNGLTAEATLVAIHTMLSELHLIHGLTAGSPLSVTVASRAAGAVSQAVAEAAGTVTVTRQ